MYNQIAYSDYGVCKKTGHIYSKKRKTWKAMSWSTGGNMKYPFTAISGDGHKKVVSFHKAACETLKPHPAPPGISKKVWKNTDITVKKLLHKIWEVNHIDEDHLNFHPSNLEWVTREQNCHLYQENRLAN